MSENTHVMPKHRKRKYTVGDILIFIVLTVVALVIFTPFYNAVVISLESNRGFALHPVSLLPTEPTLNNYAYVIKNGNILTGYASTVMITALGTVLSMIAMIAMAYVFSRRSFPGQKLLFALVMFTMFFSGGMIPTYLQFKNLGLINSRWAIILYCGVSTYNLIIMRSSFQQTPVDLEEAAKIDGANDITIFFRVMLPLQGAVIATFTLFTAVGYWNEWFWSMLLINSSGKMTLQTVLRAIVAESAAYSDIASGDTDINVFTAGIKMAAVVMTTLPIMCFYPFLQKYFVKGVLVGSIKM